MAHYYVFMAIFFTNDLKDVNINLRRKLIQLQNSMESGERTARSITELYLGRIAELNTTGPELRAIIETNPDALAIADEPIRSRPRFGLARPPIAPANEDRFGLNSRARLGRILPLTSARLPRRSQAS